MLEIEVQVLAADAKVMTHAREDAETALYVALKPDSRLARLEAEAKAHERTRPAGRTDPPDTGYRQFCIERACYGWRRDYGEWPTFTNLTDRLANEVGITHAAAAQRISAAVNDPSDRVRLHAIRAARLAEILQGGRRVVGPWHANQVNDLRFYVTADASTDNIASAYRTDQWRREAVS